jgi:hypothetical protein
MRYTSREMGICSDGSGTSAQGTHSVEGDSGYLGSGVGGDVREESGRFGLTLTG